MIISPGIGDVRSEIIDLLAGSKKEISPGMILLHSGSMKIPCMST